MWAEFTIACVAFLAVVFGICGMFAVLAYGVELVMRRFVTWYVPRTSSTPSQEAPRVLSHVEPAAEPVPSSLPSW